MINSHVCYTCSFVTQRMASLPVHAGLGKVNVTIFKAGRLKLTAPAGRPSRTAVCVAQVLLMAAFLRWESGSRDVPFAPPKRINELHVVRFLSNTGRSCILGVDSRYAGQSSANQSRYLEAYETATALDAHWKGGGRDDGPADALHIFNTT
jgi:hypothetical protein